MTKHITFYILAVLLALASMMPIAAMSQDSASDNEDYTYVEPSMKNLSQMYWRLNKFTPEQNWAVDNFMMINECQIFKDYYHNEFEWREIRKVGEASIKTNINSFPLRFEFTQPLSLAQYDFERKGFHVIKDHAIENTRVFEVVSDDMNKDICGEENTIPGYPRVLRIELSRPLSFDFVPMEEKDAERLVLKKSEAFRQLDEKFQTKDNLYSFRNAIMVMKVKLFAYKPEDIKTQHNYYISRVMGVLEGIEVYGDRDREDLLYEEHFRRKKPSTDYENRMKQKFIERKEKQRQQREAEKKAAEEKATEEKAPATQE